MAQSIEVGRYGTPDSPHRPDPTCEEHARREQLKHEDRIGTSVGFGSKLRSFVGVPLVAIAVLLLAAGALGGCSSASTRSVAAYCHTFYQQGTQLRNQWQGVGNNMNRDPLGALVSLVAAPSQMATLFGQLDEVAPQSIEPDVAQIQQALQQEVNNAGQDITNPIVGVIGGLASSIATAPAWTAVNHWTDTNCGPPPGTKWLSGSGNP
jgi:hypothetical protein